MPGKYLVHTMWAPPGFCFHGSPIPFEFASAIRGPTLAFLIDYISRCQVCFFQLKSSSNPYDITTYWYMYKIKAIYPEARLQRTNVAIADEFAPLP
jgi:hypothetical protein